MVCGAGAGKISQTSAGAGPGGFKFCECGAGADTKFQPAQDSSACTGAKVAMPPKFLENIILCFERRFSKQNSVIRLKPNILPPIFLGWLRHCTTDFVIDCKIILKFK